MDEQGMKMIWAVIRPEVVDTVVKALSREGFGAMTRFDVWGRGKQNGVLVSGQSYDMPKTVLMSVVMDADADEVVRIIEDNARTGSIGDGRIFVTPVLQAHTIRTGESGP
ncbi:putative nitrogen regulatory PII-like protein [uncultured archaeon]|nr:putative nitrogen regulatory PII-like protein [uncultured archaeon]